MPNTVSGAEGKAVVGTGGSTIALCCGTWTLESSANLKEDTSACTAGHEHRASVKKGEKLTIDIFVSSAHQPEEDTIIPGNEVTMSLRVGTLKAYNSWLFIIDSVSLKGCDADGLVTYSAVMYSQAAKPALATWTLG
jgi:hypothetical protein